MKKIASHLLEEKARIKNDWPLRDAGGLPLLFSPLLAGMPGLTHAFTTRLGGQSLEPLQWFNLGRHWPSEQSRRDATANRSRLCRALSLDFSRLVVPGQVHSTRIAWVSEPESLPDVDAVASSLTDTPILLHYADCVPVIIFEQKTAAVCVVHAGWRGTAGGIVARAVRAISATLDAEPENMVAAVGPAIGDCCYPVGEDVARELAASAGGAERLIRRGDGRLFPDLKALNALQLLDSGVGAVDVCSFCTACRTDLFYSHRASGGKTGRQGAIACLRPLI